jgi:diguanylate cyclase (GGDEF)-like protein
VAKALGSVTRRDDFGCRVGGDEFVLVAPGADAKGLERLAHRLQQRLQEATQDMSLQISVGIAAAPQHPAEELLRMADEALYRSKQQGRNCIHSA